MADTISVTYLGGPVDGETIDIDAKEKHLCSCRFAADGIPHYYVVVPHNGKDTFVYAGTSPYGVVKVVRPFDSALADELEAALQQSDD
jgi:hypothetical protein